LFQVNHPAASQGSIALCSHSGPPLRSLHFEPPVRYSSGTTATRCSASPRLPVRRLRSCTNQM